MNKLFILIFALVLCAFSAYSCLAEADYDPYAEGYYMVSTADETALAFAKDFAKSNEGLYQQFGVKTALYLFDTMEGIDLTDDTMEALLSIHEGIVGDTADDMVILILLDKNDYRFWLGENVREKCSSEALTEVIEAVKAEENDTIFTEIAKAYMGISYRFLAASIGTQANGGN